MWGRLTITDVARRKQLQEQVNEEVEAQVQYRTRTASAVLSALSQEMAALEAQGMTLSPSGVRERIAAAHQALVGTA